MTRWWPGVAVAAMCLALGGTGGAVAVDLVTGADIKNGTVTSQDVRDRSLSPADFTPSASGPAGPVGARGPAGASSGAGYSWVFKATSTAVPASDSGKTLTLACPAGSTVLGGAPVWDRTLDLIDSKKVPGQEAWTITVGNVSGNATAYVQIYVWCAGLSAPVVVP